MIGTYCSVRFFLNYRHQRNDEKVPICLRININRKKAELFLNQFADPKHWDDNKQRVIVRKKSDSFLNHKLNEIENKINDILWELEQENEVVTSKVVMQRLTGKASNHKSTILNFIGKYIEEITAKGEISTVVIKQYRTMGVHLANYIKSTSREDILLSRLKLSDLDGFEHYLLTYIHPILNRSMNRNTSNKYLTRLKSVVLNAMRKQLITVNPFDGFKIKNVKVETIYLTKEEIELLKSHELSGNESLIRVRDMFLFSVYTGLRYSDAIALKAEHIKKGNNGRLWIIKKQKKTKDTVEIPLFDQAKVIYDKYESHRLATRFVLPRLSNQKVNANLKEIFRLIGINKPIHFHVARHTFATTILLENEVELKTVSRMLGHRSIKATEIYAKITQNRLENVAGKIDTL